MTRPRLLVLALLLLPLVAGCRVEGEFDPDIGGDDDDVVYEWRGAALSSAGVDHSGTPARPDAA